MTVAPPADARRFLLAAWDTVFEIGGQLSDTVLLLPRLIAAGSGPVVFDYGDHAVKSFAADGRLRWRFGRHGKGPGEFSNPFDVAVGPDGAVWIVDVGIGRITVLSAEGRVRRMLRPDAELVTAVVPGESSARVLTTAPDRFWIHIDSAGRISGSGAIPVAALRSGHPFTRQALASGGSTGGRWAVVFPYSNVILVYQQDRLRCRGQLVEGRPAPAVAGPDVPIWVAGLAVMDSMVATLPRGETEDRLRMLDLYGIEDCRYLGSVRIGRRVRAVAYARGTFYFEHEDPAPALLALRLRW